MLEYPSHPTNTTAMDRHIQNGLYAHSTCEDNMSTELLISTNNDLQNYTTSIFNKRDRIVFGSVCFLLSFL